MEEHSAPARQSEEPTDGRLAAVLRLTTAVADQVLDAQIMKRPVPDEQVKALANAALLLQEHEVPLPPLLMQVLHEIGAAGLAKAVAGDEHETATEAARPSEAKKARDLAWLLRPFQGRK